MNEEWSNLCKTMQTQISKKSSFPEGVDTLIQLRTILMEEMLDFQNRLSIEQFCAIPFINAKGYHSKTVAYSLWHIFRIEDIVANSLIQRKEEVLIAGDYQRRMHAPIITTGNELVKMQIAEFSEKLDIAVLYEYIQEVYKTSNHWLRTLSATDCKRKMLQEDRKRVTDLQVVSTDDNAFWLIDYWCGKDVLGLLKMPFSRHWIMHVEASLRIIEKLNA